MSMLNYSMTRRASLALAGLALASAAAVSPAAAQEIKKGGTLVVATVDSPRHLNGAVQSGWATGIPSTQLFASPLRFDDKWNPQPYLAEKWSLSSDGLSLTLNLRKNAVFHDGQPITSADVAFSIMAIKANHPFNTMLAPVEKVDTPDAHTAIIRLRTPHPAILLAMSPALCPILPKHIYGDGQDLKTHPRNSTNVVGSGPFKLVEWQPNQRIVLEKFDKFFLEGKPYLDKVIVAMSADATSATLGVERGDAQMMPFTSKPANLSRLADNNKVAVLSKGYEGFGGVTWLAFNLTRKPFSDIAVRKAIAMSLDRKFIAKALQGGYAEPLEGPLHPSSPFATKDVVHYPLDLKKAAQILDDAGYKAGENGERFRMTMDYFPGADEWSKNGAEYARTQLKKVGIMVDIRAQPDFPTWAKRMADHDFDVSIDGVFNWGDPVIGVHRTYLSSNIKPVVWSNTQSYKNPKVDALLNQAGQEVDPAKRKAEYAEFQKIVTDELPVAFLTTQGYRTVVSARMANPPTSIWGPLSPYDEIYFK
ncbi:MAG: ABC transporter substrate-binding protein [Gammaproteobacteria bacterium]|nr:ABC transporter substrate-binding protein [Gammaproteobacteria bacterium]MBU1440832.1 ABC transporter substrate-binding protein [Gammaproteobacteria bacterium]MBU2284974.1 ABC transporter substrate-binding protein [Gammaproteobacteria bacterium]MBU2410023.1 ABC transporter substrate-binding protein [Gammaproteobacteria bacterium]